MALNACKKIENKPNIILLMTDQQRWDSLGCNGNRFVSTPHLERLAREGARFENSYTPWPVCTPARATMWTGVYPHKHGIMYNVYDMDDAVKELSAVKETVFDILKKNEYTTAYIGKWHLGDEDPGMFDLWEGFNSKLSHWIDGVYDGEYRADVQTDRMIEFLEEQKDSAKPFCVVNGYYPPHDPMTAPKKFYEGYRGEGVPFAGYYAAVSAIDDNVGRIMEALKELQMEENTIIVYFSDHGEAFQYRSERHNVFKTHKGSCHEESIKIPLIVRWKGKIEEGLTINQFTGLEDLMPTILDWAGIQKPGYLQGKSLAPLLNQEDVTWRDSYYVQNIALQNEREQRCVLTNKWKLIATRWRLVTRSYSGENILYNLEDDPEEERNVYENPENSPVIMDLAGKLKQYAEEIGDEFGIDLAEKAMLEISKREARRGNP